MSIFQTGTVTDEAIAHAARARYEYSTKQAILRIADTPEEAQEIVQFLASLDWHEVFAERDRRESDALLWKMEQLNKDLMRGAGICYQCNEFVDTLYDWPHVLPIPIGERHIDGIEGIGQYKKFCWKCFDSIQENIETVVRDAYISTHQDEMNTAWRLITWKNRMARCRNCHRLLPERSQIDVAGHGKYCIHCVEIVTEKQFSNCSICGKKTLNSLLHDACFDCKAAMPYLKDIGSNISRARAKGLSATLTPQEWFTTVTHFNGLCAYCRHRPYTDLEHFIPITLGGGTTHDNCVPACHICNRKKHNIHPDKLSPRVFVLEHVAYIREYLRSEKTILAPLPSSDRALVIYNSH